MHFRKCIIILICSFNVNRQTERKAEKRTKGNKVQISRKKWGYEAAHEFVSAEKETES